MQIMTKLKLKVIFLNLFLFFFKKNRRLQKKLVKDIKIFLKKLKKKKQQYGCERYKNRSEDKKQKLFEYRKKYYRMRKNALL